MHHGLLKLANLRPAYPASLLFLPKETTIEALAHISPLPTMLPDQIWCFLMWPLHGMAYLLFLGKCEYDKFLPE